jgi:hypothetical protein
LDSIVEKVIFMKNVKVTEFDKRSLSVSNSSFIDEDPSCLGEIYKKIKRYQETNPIESQLQLSQPLCKTTPINDISDVIGYTANGSKEFVVRATVESYDNSPYLACSNSKCPPIKVFIDEKNNKKCKTC